MKKKLLSMRFVLTVLALLLCTSKLMADDNVLRFSYRKSDHTAGFVANSYIGDVIIPEKVIYKEEEYTVNSVERGAFDRCVRVTSITLPPTIKEFYASLSDCIFLDRINISSVESFLGMYLDGDAKFFQNGGTELYLNGKLVESIVIPNSVTNSALQGYKKLKSVTFNNPETASFEKEDFKGCTNIDTLIFMTPEIYFDGFFYESDKRYKKVCFYGKLYSSRSFTYINSDLVYIGCPEYEDLPHSSNMGIYINTNVCIIDNLNQKKNYRNSISICKVDTCVFTPKVDTFYASGVDVKKSIYLNPSIKIRCNYQDTMYVVNCDTATSKWADYEKIYLNRVKPLYKMELPNGHTFEYSGVSPFSAIGIVDSTDIVKTKWNEELLPKNVGEYEKLPITFEVKGFKFDTSLPFKYTITKAPLTILADNKTREYGNENPTFTCTYYGLKNGEDENALDAKPIVYSTASTDSPVGSYPIIPANAQATNYTISYENGALTIVPASQTITWDQEITKAKVGDIIELTATSSANLKVKFSSSNTAVADIYTSKGKVYMECLAAGTARITASQAGDTNHAEADDIVKRITVEDISTSISGIESETKVVGYYSVDGRKVETPTKGLYIVKYADGHKRKVIIK